MKSSMITRCLFLGIFIISMSYAGPFSISGPPAADVDTDPATILNLNTSETGIITDLNVQIEFGAIDFSYWGNFDIWIEHNGVSVQLMKEEGNDDRGLFNVIFDDEATENLPYHPFGVQELDVFGFYLPYEPLSSFNGLDLSGDWTLILLDDYFPEDGTDLLSWSINGETSAVPEPSAMIMTLIGLTGFVVFRKKSRKS